MTTSDLVKISDLFNLKYGHSLEYNKFIEDSQNGINFVSRTAKNNGVSGKILLPKNSGIVPEEGPVITVALGGSVLSTFLHLEPLVTGYHVQLLKPKEPMSNEKMLYYCMVIEANKWKYSYGRQANKTLKDLSIPVHMPEKWRGVLTRFDFEDFKKPISSNQQNIDYANWDTFLLTDLFDVTQGDFKIPIPNRTTGEIPLITSGKFNNGCVGFIDNVVYKNKKATLFDAGSLTFAKDGSVGETFLQPKPFVASNHVNILTPKQPFSQQVMLFISTILKSATSKRYSFGYAVSSSRLSTIRIALPVTASSVTGKAILDIEWIEDFMNGLNWSSSFLSHK